MSRWVAMFVLTPVLAVACGIDSSLKQRCERDQDCVAGRVCFAGRCLAPLPDAASPVDAGDASADRTNDAARDASASPNYMFVTSQKYSLDWETLDVPDLHCNQAAAEAGLPGVYRAWLSTSDVDARDRLAGARGWIRPDGAPFADTVDDLVHGRIFHPPSVDEHGQTVVISTSMDDPVVTGTTVDGVLQTEGNCRDWGEAAFQAQAGLPDTTKTTWTQSYANAPCGRAARIYCFGVDGAARVAPERVAGKVAFLSWRLFTSGGGIERADDLCNMEAAEAGLPGTFLAFLARDAVPAAARFAAGERWLRPDGVALNAPGTDLFATRPLATLNVTARGDYEDRGVVTGGPGPDNFQGGTVGNCDDWHGTEPTAVAAGGLANSISQWSTRWIWGSCAYPASIYCFQQ